VRSSRNEAKQRDGRERLDSRKTWENTGNARGKKRVIGNKGGKAELPITKQKIEKIFEQ
jgi:hypothetical protein